MSGVVEKASPTEISAPLGMTELEKLAFTVACGITFGYAASLAMTFAAHVWILDANGHPVAEDFVAFWSAGREALKGIAFAAYDAKRQHAAEIATIGHGFSGTLGWSYPPVFLLVAALLARLPYVPAFIAWCGTTCAGYAGTVALIARRPAAFALACAAPWTFLACMPGQNGFLTAALIGSVLLLLEKRPLASGFLLGLLSYKPQFGLLFPLALAAGGYWRAFGWAVIGTIAWNALAGAIFGFDTIHGFFHALAATAQTHLAHAGLGWSKLQSVYGLVRVAGGSASAAALIQALASLVICAGIVMCWRTSLPYALKAAALAAGAPLATPYVFVYDLPMLAVATAFLFRHRAFDRVEYFLLATTIPSLFVFLWLPIPSAFFASLAVAAIVFRRCYAELARNRIGPSWLPQATSLPSWK